MTLTSSNRRIMIGALKSSELVSRRIYSSVCYATHAMNFSATIRHSRDVTLIDLHGALTFLEVAALGQTIRDLLNNGHKKFVLNLGDVRSLDSSGIGELVRNYMTVTNRGGDLKMLNLSPKVQEILTITKLSQVFEDFSDEQSALESFGKSEPGKPQ
jgi:anti-sigma B factor antagonist